MTLLNETEFPDNVFMFGLEGRLTSIFDCDGQPYFVFVRCGICKYRNLLRMRRDLYYCPVMKYDEADNCVSFQFSKENANDVRLRILQRYMEIDRKVDKLRSEVQSLRRARLTIADLEKCEIKRLVPFPCGCRFTKNFYEGVCNAGGICENIISSEVDGKEGYYLRVHDQNKCLICIEREAKHDQ